MNTSIISNKSLIEDLRRVKNAVRGSSVSRRVYRNMGRHASSTVEERFVTWSRAKKAAGIR